MHANDDFDPGHEFQITKTSGHKGGGTWVTGRTAGYRFEALVFAEHADCPEWELGTSRISKLWVFRGPNKQTVFNWDRGLDVAAADEHAQAVVDYLAEGLADLIYT